MADTASDERDQREATRLELDPDTLHEGDEGLAVDCPQCGTTVPIVQLVTDGACPNALDPDEVEVADEETEPQDVDCDARLSLELVWWA